MKANNFLSAFVLLLFVFLENGNAQWIGDPNSNNPICTDESQQYSPRVCSDGTNGAIIVWEDNRNGGQSDLYIQKINSDGVIQWSADGVPVCKAPTYEIDYDIISDGEGGAILIWVDSRNSTSSSADIYAQKINSAGSAVWILNGIVVCNATGLQEHPQVTSDGSGGAIIVWGDRRNGTIYPDIYIQKISSSGTAMWTVNGVVLCNANLAQYAPKIAGDGAGGAITIWQDHRSNTYVHIYGQRVNSLGNVLWNVNGKQIISGSQSQIHYESNLISDNSGGAIFTWDDNRASTLWKSFAQKINSDGVQQWQSNGVHVVNDSTTTQLFPRCTGDGAGGAIVIWWNGVSLKTQKLNSSGSRQWSDSGVTAVSFNSNPVLDFNIVSDGAGGVIVCWDDERLGPDNWNVYANKVSSHGLRQWESDVIICSAPNRQNSSILVSDGSNGAIISWFDNRDGHDIYATRLFSNGTISRIEKPGTEILPAFDLFQNFPNPFNPVTTISFDLQTTGKVKLNVFDIKGNEVSVLVDQVLGAGTYNYQFNGSALSSGTYFYKLLVSEANPLESERRSEAKKMILTK